MANKLQLNFSGGMNPKTSPLIIKDNEAELIVNFNLDKLGMLTRRKSWGNSIGQIPQNGKNVNGLYQFNKANGTLEQFMVANNSGNTNGIIYYNDGGLWATAKTNDTASKKTRFATFVDYAFRVNGSDVVASTTNSTSWGTTNCPATITPNFIAVFQDRVYVANGGSATGSRFWFSSLPSAGAITWDTSADFVDVNPDDGDQITALENNGNRLLIFKNRAMYRWVFGQVEPDRVIGVGTSSQESVKTNFDIGITFFANQQGVYAYTGGRPKLISRKIQPWINVVSNWTNVYGEVDDDHYYLAVGDLTLDGKTITNAMLVYTISLDAWVIYSHSSTVPITWMARLMPTSPVEYVYVGVTGNTTVAVPQVFRINDGLSGTDTGQLYIDCEFISKEYLLSFPTRTNLQWLDIFSQNRQEANTFYDLDRQGDFTPLGALIQRITNFRIPTRECNSVRIKITNNSGGLVNLEGFNMQHEPKEKRDETTVNVRRRSNVQ